MGLERTDAGTFDAHCDLCGNVIELDVRNASGATSKLRRVKWKRTGHIFTKAGNGGRRPGYTWHCENCPAPTVTSRR